MQKQSQQEIENPIYLKKGTAVLAVPWVAKHHLGWVLRGRTSTAMILFFQLVTKLHMVVLHSMMTFHHAKTRASRVQRLRIARIGVLKRFRLPRVMSRSLPDLTLTTSTSSLSPISMNSPIFPTVSPLHTSPMILDPCVPPSMFHGRVADQHKSHLSQVMSPSRLRIKPWTPKQSSLKTSSTEESSLTGILGQIRIKDRKDLWETLLLKMWTNLEKLVQRCPISSHRCIPIMTQRSALQTRILKMENYEKSWLHL